MLALASGSQMHYDFTYADSDVLQDTEYNDLYYTNYRGWTEAAARQYKAAKNIVGGVSDYTISKYEISGDGNVLTTTYSKGGQGDVVVKIDKKNATATVDGQNVNIENCIEGGLK